jgi:copper transport protein
MINLTWKKSWIMILLVMLLVILTPPTASAHAILIRSDPADNATLPASPAEIRLWFNEAISMDFSSAQILDINGHPLPGLSVRVDPAENLLILTPPKLPDGLFSVRWKVLSETDGHFTQGLLVFGLGEGVKPDSSAVLETAASVPWPEVVLRWLNFAALMALAGSVAVAYLVLGSTRIPSKPEEAIITPVRQAARRRVLVLAAALAGTALLVGGGLLAWQVITLSPTLPQDASLGGAAWQLLSRTRWGLFWLVRQVMLLVLAGILFRLYQTAGGKYALPSHLDRSVPLRCLAALLVAALLLGQTLTGHAAALNSYTSLALAADLLHLLAASLWVGGLLALAAALLPLLPRHRNDFAALIRAGWQPFSRLAAFSVLLLIATGLYSTGRQVASLDALVGTLYGQALAAKLIIMLLAGAAGALNSILLHPGLAAPLARRLHHPAGWTPLPLSRLPQLVILEASLGLLVLGATAILTAAPPARGPQFEVAAENIPTVLDQATGDMLVTFLAKPNRPGQNIFTVRAASTRRPAPAEVMRVILRFTYLGQEMGRTSADALEIEPGLYQVGGNYFSLAGDWQVQVVVRRKGIEDQVAEFHWIVAPPGPMQPVFISKSPLAAPLTLAAGGIGLVTLLLIGAWLGRDRLAKLGNIQDQVKQVDRRSDKDETGFFVELESGSRMVDVTQPHPGWLWGQPAAGPNGEYEAGS